MSLRRIANLFVARNLGQVVTTLTQLLLPPAFLHSFGLTLYGEWIALSAAISHLGTMNYGLQTYTTTQMTIHYNRGETSECRHVQSAGLRIMLGALFLICSLLLVIFVLPLNSLLHLTIPLREAQWTLYILGCQIMASMLLGFCGGSYMAIGLTHRSANISNVYQLLVLVAQVSLVLVRASFVAIAGVQLLFTLLVSLFLFLDFGRLAPDIRPTLRYWQPGMLKSILKPSAQYAMLSSFNVFFYQIPVLLMQRILGPFTVVVYSVTRTVFSMGRRILFIVSDSIGPEATLIYGQQDWKKLRKLYEFSERIILLLIPPVTFGVMLASPLLLRIWLHKPNLFVPNVALLLGLIIGILGIKEHKYQFQFSTNRIQATSYATVISGCVLIAAAIPMMMRFGLTGYLVLWCGTEVIGLLYLLYLNAKLFGKEMRLDRRPVYQLLAFLAFGTAALFWPLYHITNYPYYIQALIALGATGISLGISYRMFRFDEVRSYMWRKISSKFAFTRWRSA